MTNHRSSEPGLSALPSNAALLGLAGSYPLLLIGSLLLKPGISIPSALFPPVALAFSAYYLLPAPAWPVVFLITTLFDLLVIPSVISAVTASPVDMGYSLELSLSATLICVGMAAAIRVCRLGERDEPPQAAIAPTLVLALSLGALPGDLLSTWLHARSAHQSFMALDVAVRNLSSILTIVALCPLIIGLLRGFDEPIRPAAGRRELVYLALTFFALCVVYFLVPWRLDRFLELMLLAGPMLWLALRCSHRAVAIVSAIVALGIGTACAHGVGQFPPLVSVGAWRDGILSTQVFLLITCGEAVLINRIVLKQRALLEDSRRKQAMLTAYGRALDEAEDVARRSAARDLHDGVAQIVAGQGLILGALRSRMPDGPLSELVDQALSATREAQSAVRTSIEDLSPPEMESASLQELLAWIADFFAERYRFGVKWQVRGDAAAADGYRRMIYRAVRELVFNAYKHSQTQTVDVLVTCNPDGLLIDVTDQGAGFDLDAPVVDGRRRLGLAQLSERVAIAGGGVDMTSTPGAGCRITVRLPRLQPTVS
jgi:signal transduction histidine kinase